MEHVGGLDRFILRQDETLLSPRAKTVRKNIVKKLTQAKKG
jgi:hypothetical protein